SRFPSGSPNARRSARTAARRARPCSRGPTRPCTRPRPAAGIWSSSKITANIIMRLRTSRVRAASPPAAESMDFIDEEGYRANVGIILMDGDGRVLIAGRRGRGGWQFPQGGVRPDESTESAMYRELHEEVGLAPSDVELVGQTRGWLRYRLPQRYVRREQTPVCVGQKQRWFLLQLHCNPARLRF